MRRTSSWWVALAVVAGLLAPTASGAADGEVRIRVLSSRADLVSGGDALVEVTLPHDHDGGELDVRAGAHDVRDAFRETTEGRYVGLVTGLPNGRTVLTARLRDGRGATLAIDNHPRTGPLFSGPHLQPLACTTVAAGLGEPTDADCSAATRFDYVYKSAATGQFEAYDPANPPNPALVAQTTTDEGHTVDYVVRRERGVINRAIYDVAVLYDPAAPAWTPWERSERWNGKLYYLFGGGCRPTYHQGVAFTDVLNDMALSRGFAVASSTFNFFGEYCNDVTSAETLAMVKEHIVETYGEIRYTMSEGGSGGAMQQHLIAANYPGLLDGIQPSASYPDLWSILPGAVDCELLVRHFEAAPAQLWADPNDRAAVAGNASPGTCLTWSHSGHNFAEKWLHPRTACPGAGLPPGRYDAERNRSGTRCTIQDFMVNVFGRRPGDGFANRPWDNVGIQYGLDALKRGDITAEQFVALNAGVGGLDIDFDATPARSAADEPALRTAYRAGQVTSGDALDETAIVDLRLPLNHEIHTDVHSHALRARLHDANGHADNHVIVTGPTPAIAEWAFEQLDAWLAAVEADRSDDPRSVKVARARPADLADGCYAAGGAGVTDEQVCRAVFPYYGDTRTAAGAPLANDVLKCQLVPLDRSAYPVAFTDAQWTTLQETFPTGVCDWSRPGVGQEERHETWVTFADGPGGRPLGPAPASQPLVPAPRGALALEVVSARAETVSGGDALVEVRVPPAVAPGSVTVTRNGADVTAAFGSRGDGRLVGLVSGLVEGRNLLEVSAPGAAPGELAVANHPVAGPIISGPHQTPFACRTNAAGLGKPLDDDCTGTARADLYYMSASAGDFQPYDRASPPDDADVATTTTSDGRSVPYVVRVESFTVNRSITRVAVLWDVDAGWDPSAPYRGWNRKLVVRFGGGCGPGRHQGNVSLGDVLGNDDSGGLQSFQFDRPLAEGYAVAASSLLKLGVNCNDVVAAETLMMLKEHVVERYGELRYTVGVGASGGGILQHAIADAYPGLLDGIMVGASFPDIWSTLAGAVDCALLARYFDEVSPQLWAAERQRAAVSGHHSWPVCVGWDLIFASLIRPTRPPAGPTEMGLSCNPSVSDEEVYDPETNPDGVRCTLQDHMVNVFGRDPATGFARRPYGNVGVQYGLRALEQGLIVAEQFVDLNEKVGGFDIDANVVPQRVDADLEAVRIAHRTGRVTNGGGGLRDIPIIDFREIEPDKLLIHDRFRTDSMRDRLTRGNGGAANHVSFMGTHANTLAEQSRDALHVMDQWLLAVQADDSSDAPSVKVARSRPAGLVDRCYGGAGVMLDRRACDTVSPPHGDPRTAAGGPRSNDVIRCQLVPLDRSSYPVAFTDAQWARLSSAFPGGVCDWSQPGVGQDEQHLTWVTFADGPGGRPLAASPTPTGNPRQ